MVLLTSTVQEAVLLAARYGVIWHGRCSQVHHNCSIGFFIHCNGKELCAHFSKVEKQLNAKRRKQLHNKTCARGTIKRPETGKKHK